MGVFFKRTTSIFDQPSSLIVESFEYNQNWSGTISNVFYVDSFIGFNTPSSTITEEFETTNGW